MFTIQFALIAVDLLGSFLCLIAIFSILIGKTVDKKSARRLIALIACLMLMLICDVITHFSAEAQTVQNTTVIRIVTYLTYFFGFLDMPLAAEYLTYLIESRSGIKGILWRYVEWAFFTVGVVLITVNLFTGFIYTIDEDGFFRPQNLSVLPATIAMVGIIITVGVVMLYLNYLETFEKAAFISYLLLPFIAIGTTLIRSDIELTMPAVTVSVLMLYFSYEVSSREYRIELERNLAERQITMFYHQIQPHFIFNSLAMIKHQCRTAPDKAMDTIDDFSDYLRDSTDLMSATECVSAERELDLVRHYICLQKKRFEEIDYRVEIEDTDFAVPPFAIQTCVENSITHGLRGQTGKNSYILVKTYKNRSQHVIIIEDNGVGFDVQDLEELPAAGHVGLMNTEERIRLMCNGSMKIESEIGRGTKITMTIPESKEKKT